jgi:hypothetical protein
MFHNFFENFAFENNVAKYCTARQATDDHVGHAHFLLDTEGYAYILRPCNSYCFSTATKVGRTRLMLRYTYIGCLVFNFMFLYAYDLQHSARFPRLKRYICPNT